MRKAALLSRTFAMPVKLGLLQAVGLLSALLGDGLWDLLSWATLGVTLIVVAHYPFRRAPYGPATR